MEGAGRGIPSRLQKGLCTELQNLLPISWLARWIFPLLGWHAAGGGVTGFLFLSFLSYSGANFAPGWGKIFHPCCPWIARRLVIQLSASLRFQRLCHFSTFPPQRFTEME